MSVVVLVDSPLTLTPVLDPVPMVEIVVGSIPGGPSVIRVERSTGGGWEPVRGAADLTVTGAWLGRDFECPLNVPATYRLVVDGVVLASVTTSLETATSWLHDPLNPRAAVPVSIDYPRGGVDALRATARTATFPQAADLVVPAGSRVPVGSIGTRQLATGVPLVLDCLPGPSQVLRDVLDGAGPVVIRGLPSWVPLPSAAMVLVQALGLEVVGHEPRHRWSAELTQVAPPAPSLTLPWVTWQDVMDAWPGATWADLMAARPGATWLDWMRNPWG